ncbi:MAG: hypothetical protein M3P83_08435, partial [Actinomycetota bacterium]|nr:hypothetical protein [Actinomycetota bacterium]
AHVGGRDAHGPRAAVRVRLRQPPPLETPMSVVVDEDPAGAMRLLFGGALIADAAPAALDAQPVEAVTPGAAEGAEASYPGLTQHPFPTCFTCGPQRGDGDGLRLRPGRLHDGRTACTWVPHFSLAGGDGRHVRDEFVWAALDCPGGWTADLAGRPLVLGTITAQVDASAEVGERHVVMGRLLGQEGRRTFTATTVYDSDGRVVGRAEHTWVAVDPRTFADGPAERTPRTRL